MRETCKVWSLLVTLLSCLWKVISEEVQNTTKSVKGKEKVKGKTRHILLVNLPCVFILSPLFRLKTFSEPTSPQNMTLYPS